MLTTTSAVVAVGGLTLTVPNRGVPVVGVGVVTLPPSPVEPGLPVKVLQAGPQRPTVAGVVVALQRLGQMQAATREVRAVLVSPIL